MTASCSPSWPQSAADRPDIVGTQEIMTEHRTDAATARLTLSVVCRRSKSAVDSNFQNRLQLNRFYRRQSLNFAFHNP
jgi:hypothetical protein